MANEVSCSPEDVKSLVLEFGNKVKRFKKTKEYFEESKEYFEEVMNEYFEKNSIGSEGLRIEYPSDQLGFGGAVTVKRSQRTTVIFDPDKVEKVIRRKVADEQIVVVEKQYKINDIGGLVAYLRSIGADPAIFKSFISVDKTVKQDALEQLEKLGKISADDLKGCYETKLSKPFYQIKFESMQE